MKTLTARFLTFFGIALLATVMAFSLASCKHDGGDDDNWPEIPAELQDTGWSNSVGEEISFEKYFVTITPANGPAQTFQLKGTSFESAINQTTLFFRDKNSTDDIIVYRDGKITMVNFSIIENKTDPINGWKKDSYNGFKYTVEGSAITITGYTGSGGAVTIPGTIDGKSVTTIENSAFYQCGLTSVIIPDSVITIGRANKGSFSVPNGAFADNELTSVTIGNGVTLIGESAFAWNQLTSVTIPNSVASISGWAFYINELTSVTIGANVICGDQSFGADSFPVTYNNLDKQAGTYIFTGTITHGQYGGLVYTGSWSKQP